MRIVITGGAGFLGRRLARALLAARHAHRRRGRRDAIARIVLLDCRAAACPPTRACAPSPATSPIPR